MSEPMKSELLQPGQGPAEIGAGGAGGDLGLIFW